MTVHRGLADAPSAPRRMLAPDLARGAMLLLIVLAHAPLYLVSVGTGAFGLPASGSVLDQTVRIVGLLTVDNRAYPMFAALFGYGMVMVITRQRAKDGDDSRARRLLRRRGWWLLVFGFGHALLVTPVDILGAYGLATLLVGWLFFRRERALLIGAAVLSVWFVFAITAMSFFENLPAQGSDTSVDTFALGAMGYAPVDIVERLVVWVIAVVSNNAVFPIVIAMLLGGWAAKRRVLEDPAHHRRTLRLVAVTGLLVALVGAVPKVLVDVGQLPADAAWLAQSLHVMSGLFGGLAYTAVFGLIGARLQNRQGRVVALLAATGRRSLTCYLLQSTLLIVMLSQTFLGIGGSVNSAGAALVAVLAWLGGVTAAALLERAHRPGPADALLRRLVYRQAKPARP